jgi:hypothetical protein
MTKIIIKKTAAQAASIEEAEVQKDSLSAGSGKKSKSKTEVSSQRFSVIAILLFLLLFAVSIYKLYQNSAASSDVVISGQVQKLQSIFQQIHQHCGIVDFEHERNYIDFLTIERFVGSEVGSMNLLYPKEWAGPYVEDNPTIQEKQYVVLHNKSGYFIVPDNGVKLTNGAVVGIDFVLNYETDMEQAMNSLEQLKSDSGVLAATLDVGKNTLTQIFLP